MTSKELATLRAALKLLADDDGDGEYLRAMDMLYTLAKWPRDHASMKIEQGDPKELFRTTRR